MIYKLIFSLIVLLNMACSINNGSETDENIYFVFSLSSHFFSGNDTLIGYTTPDLGQNAATENYVTLLWNSKHFLSLHLVSYENAVVVYDTILPLDSGKFRWIIPDDFGIDSLYIYGEVLDDNNEFVGDVPQSLFIRFDSQDDSIKSYIDMSSDNEVEPIYIGNPSKIRYSSNSSFDCQARSVWEMQLFEGNIFIGAGDLGDNAGPVKVWSISPTDSFELSLTLNEEEVSLFHVSNSQMLIPGLDPIGSPKYGNIYQYKNGQLENTIKVPNAIHVLDVVEYNSTLWTIINFDGYIAYSVDAGDEWITVNNPYSYYSSFNRILNIGNKMYFFGDISIGYCEYKNDSLILHIANLLPRKNIPGGDLVYRIQRYNDSFIYNTKSVPYLHYYDGYNKNAKIISALKPYNIQDVLVKDDIAYVLTANQKESEWVCRILKSSDLIKWQSISSFMLPATPCSFEMRNGDIYVGLGNRGRLNYSDSASGNIYKISVF